MANIGNAPRAGRRDWTIILSFTEQTGPIFQLGDADGSTKGVTSLRVDFEGAMQGDSPLDLEPKLAHNGTIVAARIHEGKRGFVDIMGALGMATSMTVKTNAMQFQWMGRTRRWADF